ncbi:sialidase family protein [Flavimaricola marinus]|uniref:BNR/Asp-box repeat protein n=1 Tax=Flavimaricola marinus TaxID=1819565 RepID=A0A238LIU2_9RHOB|nr:sialidase family protein [Flavimaricola marinus]SMY08876.1 BNR/Asp-box repeat protein [Flavimaricola marinus]
MKISLDAEATIYANPNPLLVSRQAVFPGLAALPNGDLLAMFSIGQAFDSADMRAVVSRSTDGGHSWATPRPLHEGSELASESFKPTLLPDGRILALGYVFERPDDLTPIVDPDTMELLPLRNRWSISEDQGVSWSAPFQFSVEGAPLELSGPAIVLPDGRLIAAGAPFHLGPGGHEGWIIASDDAGANWRRQSIFYRAPGGHVAPWECRLCHLGGSRIAVIFWAYDAQAQVNLDNHIVLSDDNGQTFGPAIATGIMGQASNVMALDENRVLSIHCHREDPVSLTVRVLRLGLDRVDIDAEFPIFGAVGEASATDGIVSQFGSLRFGQPALLRTGPDRVLATCWSVENCQHVIKGYHLKLGAGT